MCGLGDDNASMACITEPRIPAVQHVRDIAFIQPQAERIGMAVSEGKIEHGSRESTVLNKTRRVLARCGCEDHCTRRFAGRGDVHGNERFILDDEDGATSEAVALHGFSFVRELTRKSGNRTPGEDIVVTSVGHFPANATNT